MNNREYIIEKITNWCGSNIGSATVLTEMLTKEDSLSFVLTLIEYLEFTKSKPESLWVCYSDLNKRDIDETIVSIQEWMRTSGVEGWTGPCDLSLGEWLKTEKDLY